MSNSVKPRSQSYSCKFVIYAFCDELLDRFHDKSNTEISSHENHSHLLPSKINVLCSALNDQEC